MNYADKARSSRGKQGRRHEQTMQAAVDHVWEPEMERYREYCVIARVNNTYMEIVRFSSRKSFEPPRCKAT